MCRQSEKNLLNSNIFSTCPHNMVNFGPLVAEIHWRVWGTPAYCNRCCVLASLLQRRRSMKVNQTLHDVCPSPVLAHCIHFWGLLSPNGILPGAKFTLHPSLAFSYFVSVTTQHLSSGCQPNFTAWYKEWNYRIFGPRHFQQGATDIPRAATTLGIGPHSSLITSHNQ